MSAPPTRTARAQGRRRGRVRGGPAHPRTAFALGEGTDGIAATAAVALLLVACVGEAIHHRNRRGGRDA